MLVWACFTPVLSCPVVQPVTCPSGQKYVTRRKRRRKKLNQPTGRSQKASPAACYLYQKHINNISSDHINSIICEIPKSRNSAPQQHNNTSPIPVRVSLFVALKSFVRFESSKRFLRHTHPMGRVYPGLSFNFTIIKPNAIIVMHQRLRPSSLL